MLRLRAEALPTNGSGSVVPQSPPGDWRRNVAWRLHLPRSFVNYGLITFTENDAGDCDEAKHGRVGRGTFPGMDADRLRFRDKRTGSP